MIKNYSGGGERRMINSVARRGPGRKDSKGNEVVGKSAIGVVGW